MPIVAGAGVSYSPLIYRPRTEWEAIGRFLRKDAIQPKAAAAEDAALLDEYDGRISNGLTAVEQVLASSELDAVILVTTDRGTLFDSSHIPQIQLRVGGEIWGDPAIRELGEESARHRFECDEPIASLLIEELVRGGFDVVESSGPFKAVGDPDRGIPAAAVESAARLVGNLPLIPLTINCHVPPVINGRRLHRLGRALADAAALSDRRIGVLVSGGLSGDPLGEMSGWIDDVFDRWVLNRIERGRSEDLARVWDVPSRNLLGGTTEVRLWMVAAAALEHAGCRACVQDYLPIHHAATGVAFMTWKD